MYQETVSTKTESRGAMLGLAPEHLAMLRKAANDDEFRAELEQHPSRLAALLGIDAAQLPQRVTLPEKQALQGLLDEADAPEDRRAVQWFGFLSCEESTIH